MSLSSEEWRGLMALAGGRYIHTGPSDHPHEWLPLLPGYHPDTPISNFFGDDHPDEIVWHCPKCGPGHRWTDEVIEAYRKGGWLRDS